MTSDEAPAPGGLTTVYLKSLPRRCMCGMKPSSCTSFLKVCVDRTSLLASPGLIVNRLLAIPRVCASCLTGSLAKIRPSFERSTWGLPSGV